MPQQTTSVICSPQALPLSEHVGSIDLNWPKSHRAGWASLGTGEHGERRKGGEGEKIDGESEMRLFSSISGSSLARSPVTQGQMDETWEDNVSEGEGAVRPQQGTDVIYTCVQTLQPNTDSLTNDFVQLCLLLCHFTLGDSLYVYSDWTRC